MTPEILIGCACILGGGLVTWRARQIAPMLNRLQVEQLQRSVLSPKAVEEQTEMYKRPEQVALTAWFLRIFGCLMTLVGVVVLAQGLVG